MWKFWIAEGQRYCSHPEMALSCVRSNMLLTRPGFPAKHHIGEVWSYACIIHVLIGIVRAELPHGMSYRAGDYLSMLVRCYLANLKFDFYLP